MNINKNFVNTVSAQSLWRTTLYASVSILVLAGSALTDTRRASAVEITIPDGTNLLPIPIAEGDIWNLQGNAYVSDGVNGLVLKALTANFTLNGTSGGSTITVNDGAGHYAFFSSAVTSLTLTNLTFTGALGVQQGGILSLSAVLTIGSGGGNGGTLAFVNNTVGGNAGAVYSGGALAIAGTYDNLMFSTNTAGGNGGAILATGNVSISGTYGNLLFSRNTSGGGGGAIFTDSDVLLLGSYGSLVFADNAAGTDGGAIHAGGNVTVNASSAAPVQFSRNSDTAGSGGAIHAEGNVEIFPDIVMDGNNAGGTNARGGAIYSAGTSMAFHGNVSADGNTASFSGGAVALFVAPGAVGTMHFDNPNATISFTNNRVVAADASAGALALQGQGSDSSDPAQGRGDVIFDSASVTMSSNSSVDAGGAMWVAGRITFTNTAGNVTLQNNTSGLAAGAVGGQGTITFASAAVTITGNSTTTGFGGAVVAFGPPGFGGADILFTNPDATIVISGNSATTAGGALAASSPQNDGQVVINGANITIDGNSAQSGNGGAIWAGGVTINARGPATIADNQAGDSGGAVYALGNVAVTAAAGTMSFTGNRAGTGKGGAIWAGGSVSLDASGGDIIFTGNSHGDPSANAIWLDNTGGGASLSVNAASGHAVVFFDPVQNNSANGLMPVVKTGEGMLSFDGSKYGSEIDRWSQIYGTTDVQGGIFEIANNAVYGVLQDDISAAEATRFTSAPGTMLQGGTAGTLRADAVTLNGDLDIAGRQPDVRGVFNIVTHGLTLGGGAIRFNTYLNDGVEQNTDLLVLNLHGTAVAGQAVITVASAGGTGLPTVGDGIKLVETNGTGTTAGAFRLGNRVAEGAYEYSLYYGGDVLAGGNPNDQNWYLRNTVVLTEPPPDGSSPGEPPIIRNIPNIRPEVALATAIPPVATEYSYAMLGTVHERAGEMGVRDIGPVAEERTVWCKDAAQNYRCAARSPAMTQDAARWAGAGWARLIGARGFHDPGGFLRRGPDYSYTFGGIQAGLDLYARQQADGTLDKAGLYAGYGQISSDVKGLFGARAGRVDMDAYTLAGYWTHFSPAGWYADAVVQGTWYGVDARSVLGQEFKPNGFGFLGSLEGGYVFRFGDGWTLEPQMQIVYGNVSFDHVHDAFGFGKFDDETSLRGRLGLRLARSWNMAGTGDKPRALTMWLLANVWHEFLGKSTTSFGRFDGANMVPFNSYLGGTWGEVRAGFSAQMSDRVSVFATGAYDRSLDGKGRESWDGRLGLTVRW